jgi:hypothetical protein
MTDLPSPKISEQGYWLSQQEGHVAQDGSVFFDEGLMRALLPTLRGKRVCDLGCGVGLYVRWLREHSVEAVGYDGNPNTSQLSNQLCATLNLAEPILGVPQFDAIMSLEVGEHIPKRYERVFLDNITNLAEFVILSWAVPHQHGDGHVNCRSNTYIIFQMWLRGFKFHAQDTVMLRSNCTLDWLKNTVMVFSRTGKTMDVSAMYQVLRADIERLKLNNRQNSSLVAAVAGKIVRILLPTSLN